jgi:hypothetical protein
MIALEHMVIDLPPGSQTRGWTLKATCVVSRLGKEIFRVNSGQFSRLEPA